MTVTYHYTAPSTASSAGDRIDVRLATSGGAAAHPWFFDGFAERADLVAAALLVVARVARTRFYTPPNMLAAVLAAADPIVTSDGTCLRFESLSACCGVHTRLDLLPEALDRPPHRTGTTNVDVNGPMRDVLSGIGRHDPMHLAVGADELRVSTMDGTAVERRVPLPDRWVRCLAELHVIARAMTPAAVYSGAQLRRFLQTQPRGAQHGVVYAIPGPAGPRAATRPAPGGVAIAGLERLRIVEPLLLHTSAVRTFALDTGGAWLLELPGMRFTVTLSPSVSRAFSGEGGLHDSAPLAGGGSTGGGPAGGGPAGGGPAGGGPAGQVGYDLADGTTFARELPFGALVVPGSQPRLRDAERLVAEGAVTAAADHTLVRSGDSTYVVRSTSDGDRCTCAWFATHGLRRGPCKHILAARST